MADQEWNRGGGIACGFEVMGKNCQSSSPLLRHLHTCKKKLPSFLPCGEKLQRIHTTEDSRGKCTDKGGRHSSRLNYNAERSILARNGAKLDFFAGSFHHSRVSIV